MRPSAPKLTPISTFHLVKSYVKPALAAPESDTLDQFMQQAKDFYNQQLAETEKNWSLSQYQWRFDQKTKQISFEHKKKKKPNLIAEAQILGSFFKDSHEWHWAWSTVHVPKKCSKVARRLRRFGRRHQQPPLVRNPVNLQNLPHLKVIFAALGLCLSDAETAYLGHSDQQTVIFLLKNVRINEDQA